MRVHSRGLVSFTAGTMPKCLEMIEMTANCSPEGVHMMVVKTKLLAGLLEDGSDEGIVTLVHSREEVVGGLMVESSSDHCPEPAVCGIVLSGCHLQLCPVCVCVCVCVCCLYNDHTPIRLK